MILEHAATMIFYLQQVTLRHPLSGRCFFYVFWENRMIPAARPAGPLVCVIVTRPSAASKNVGQVCNLSGQDEILPCKDGARRGDVTE